MSIRDTDPVQPPLCPWHATRNCVEPATSHERERGWRWFCADGNALFEGTASEFQRIRTRVLADEAERMASIPKETEP